MKSAYLLDTDWAIDFLNGHQETVEKIRELRKSGLALSLISLAELYEGKAATPGAVLHEQVKIAVGACLTTSKRPEHTDVVHTVAFAESAHSCGQFFGNDGAVRERSRSHILAGTLYLPLGARASAGFLGLEARRGWSGRGR